MTPKKPVALIILDGWGYREETKDNAIAAAKTPVFNQLWQTYPHARLAASGEAVGLPDGQMGNSEVGHTTIGAGAPLPTELVRISQAAANDEFAANPAFQKIFAHVKQNNSVLHIIGLIGDGGVHSHQDHLIAFLKTAAAAGLTKVAIHAFADGRDTSPQSAAVYLKQLEEAIAYTGIGFIASLSGRLYAMDRDQNWDRVEKVADALFDCKGNVCQLTQPSIYLSELYKQGKVDEKLEPIIFADEAGQTYKLSAGDGVFFFNFRADRARMLSAKIAEQAAKANICFVTMTEYDPALPALVAFPPLKPAITLAQIISEAGLAQAHIAETEKFPHVTYFFNGGHEAAWPGEMHELVESRKDVLTHDLAPEMRAAEVADKAVEAIKNKKDFVLVNIANPDMVGHTANVPAIITALEATDQALGKIITAIDEAGGVAIVTADHGNAELNSDPATGAPHTAHTTNPVPIIVTDSSIKVHDGTLADLAPTVLAYLNLPKPAAMTGHTLLEG